MTVVELVEYLDVELVAWKVEMMVVEMVDLMAAEMVVKRVE